MQLQFDPPISEGLTWSEDDDEGYIDMIDSFHRFKSVK